MADHIIFLLHGMGTYDAGWHDKWVQVIGDAYARYPALQEKSFDVQFEFVPITYDVIFRKLVDTWQEEANKFADAGVDLKEFAGAVDWLKGAGKIDGNFKWTHATDVLLYRLSNIVRNDVCALVALEIKKKTVQISSGVRWSIIGHSLGTAVLHDTLTRLFANESAWLKDTPPHLVMMVANVSQVLQQVAGIPQGVEANVLKSPVQPGIGCNYFLNAEHPLDPFVWPRRFHPLTWPSRPIREMNPPRYIHSFDSDILHRSYQLDHIHDWDVHAFEHYLVSPKVHVPMFRMLMGRDSYITPQEEQSARDRFSRFGKLGDEAAEKIHDWLEKRQGSEKDDWTKIRTIWRAFFGGTHP